MSVSGLTIFVIILNMLIGIAIPVGLCIFCRKKWKCDFLPFFTGCGVMFLFAFVLEQIVHMIVLYGPAGSAIQGNIWLYALYGGLMAGLFEETGRFIAMKFLLKKNPLLKSIAIFICGVSGMVGAARSCRGDLV